jgi:hypothetical protein
MSNPDLLKTARRRANARFGFLIHLAVFIAVIALLTVINLRSSPQHHWFAFPLGGWAIGLAIHGLAVFLNGSGLRERMVAAELRKLERRHGGDAGQASQPFDRTPT